MLSAQAPLPDAAATPPAALDHLLKLLKGALVMLISAYSCTVGTLLVIFVPQRCSDTLPSYNGTYVESGGADCTFQENLYVNISPYNAGVLVVSFITVATLAYGFSVEFRRDAWIISQFGVDHSKPDDLLRTELDQAEHPERFDLRAELMARNLYYHRLFLFIAGLWALNVVLSGVLCFYFYYQDYRTITTFLMSLILVGQRINNSVALSNNCLTYTKAESVNFMEATAFNTILTAPSKKRSYVPDRTQINPLAVLTSAEPQG